MASIRPEFAAVHVLVSGRVQGVYFRAATEARANGLGLTGYVRNRPDGCTVEVYAEGPQEKLSALVEFLKVGPPDARVRDIVTAWSIYTGRFFDFSVK